jgi:hypothetical protein
VVEFDEPKMPRSIISEQPDKMIAYGRKNRMRVTRRQPKKQKERRPQRRLRQSSEPIQFTDAAPFRAL